jgi:acyl-coenzyme A thioesterase PaaI-like protein
VIAAVNAAMVKLVRELTGGVPAALVQLAVSFVASGTEDVTATAELVRGGRSMIFVTGRVVQSESGRVIATASAVFQRRPSNAEA